MSGLQFFLDNAPCIPPKEWQALEMELNWATGAPVGTLSTSKFTFEGKAAHDINTYVANGTNGGRGILEGMPFKIIDCNNLTALQGCIDTADGIYKCDSIELPIRDNRIKDYFTDRMDGFTFAYLKSLGANQPGRITTSDYINIPYVISSIPNYTQLLSTSITIFLLTKEIAEIVRKSADIGAELSVPPVTIVGALKLLFQVIYFLVMIPAAISLVNKFISAIYQPIKYKKGMYVRTLITRACSFLGLTFQSTILTSSGSKYYNSAIIPRKIVHPNTNWLSFQRPIDEAQPNSNAYGHFDGTLGDLVRGLEDMFNAKFVQRGTNVYFERIDHWNNIASYTLPNIDLNGVNNLSYKYNASELPSNYLTIYSLDSEDLNTYDQYGGTACQMQCSPNIMGDRKNVLLNGLVEKRLPFALGKRKEVLTQIEQDINIIMQIASFFSGFAQPQSRIGCLLLSSDFIGVPKFVILDQGNKIKSTNAVDTSATTLMNNYHSVSFPLSDQWLMYENVTVDFCCEDYVTLLNNNTIRTIDGRYGKLISLKWQIGSTQATIDFKIRPHNNRYTNNLNQVIISDLN